MTKRTAPWPLEKYMKPARKIILKSWRNEEEKGDENIIGSLSPSLCPIYDFFSCVSYRKTYTVFNKTQTRSSANSFTK